jgi:hypothetical protein
MCKSVSLDGVSVDTVAVGGKMPGFPVENLTGLMVKLDQRTETVASCFVQATLRMKGSRPSTRYPV